MAEEEERAVVVGSYHSPIRAVEDSAEEILLLWSIQQPTLSRQNSFVLHSSLRLNLDACGHHLTIFQSPSSMSRVGVTGAVMWDSGVVLGKFLEHAVDTGMLTLNGKKVVELGSGCGLVGMKVRRGSRFKLLKRRPIQTVQYHSDGSRCIAALLGAQAILTDLPDRLRLLNKNVEANVEEGSVRGSATVSELTWGEDLDCGLIEPLPEFVLGSDVIYSEGAVTDLLVTLRQLCGSQTTIFLAGELRNDAVLGYFLEAALEDFVVGRVDQGQWHPNYCSDRIAIFILVKKP